VGNSPAATPVLDSGSCGRNPEVNAHEDGDLATLDDHEVLPQIEFDDDALEGILTVAISGNDTLPGSAVRIQRDFDVPKAMGREATTLAALNAQGIHHPSLLGPSVQQGWLMASTQEETPWVEGRVEEKVWQDVDSVVQQRARDTLIPIPKRLDEEYRTLLAATEADWKRGTIQEIGCRLCRGARFKSWDRFKRHCNTTEAHPLRIGFCNRCGAFFSRSDSLRRHRTNPPIQCRNARPEKAAQKRRLTEKAHKEFKERLKHCGKTGEEVGWHFAHFIKTMYPESSKKRTKRKE
jgi:hypothetical protein